MRAPPVQGADPVRTVPRQQGADDLSRIHRLTRTDARFHRLIGGADPVSVVDRDHRAPGNRAGEDDRSRSGAADLRAFRGRKIDSPVPASPHHGRRIETLHDGGRCAGGPLVTSAWTPGLQGLFHTLLRARTRLLDEPGDEAGLREEGGQ